VVRLYPYLKRTSLVGAQLAFSIENKQRSVYDVQNCLLMMEAVRISEMSVDNYFTRQYIPEDNSEHHTRRRENLKSHKDLCRFF
jgi:hypothetical protein